jgi:hypothetical protein
MSSDNTLYCAKEGFYTTGGVTITSTGFSVGSDDRVNDSGVTHHWMAIRDFPVIDASTYVGDGELSQDIVRNRQPDVIFLFDTVGTDMYWKPSCLGSYDAFTFATQTSKATLRIGLLSNGFVVGAGININGTTYTYFNIYNERQSTQHSECGNYTGTAATNDVTLGWQPKWVMIFENTGAPFGFKTATMSGDDAGVLNTQYDWDASAGITITSTGFQLSAGSDFNTNGDTFVYMAGRY